MGVKKYVKQLAVQTVLHYDAVAWRLCAHTTDTHNIEISTIESHTT